MRFSDRLSATICIVFVMLFFSLIQYLYIANYNWICPYAHEYTHGIALSLAAVWAVERLVRTRRLRLALLAGVLAGLVFLTTAEVFAACALALLGGLTLAARRGRAIAMVGLFIIGAAATVAAALAMLASAMPFHTALRGLLGSWPWVFDPRIAQLGFYRASMGLDDPPARLARLGVITLGWLALFVPIALVAIAMKKPRWRAGSAMALGAVVAAALVAAGMALLRWVPWFELALPLPIWLIALLIALAMGNTRPSGAAVRLMLLILALALLGKILLFTRVQHYGFALAMPAGVMVVEAMLGSLPRSISLRGGSGSFFRIACGGALIAYCIGILFGFHLFIEDKAVSVASGRDRFLADSRGAQVNAALKEIALRSGRDDTLAVLPQGLMINYLSRRAHPNRYLNFMPPEVITAGEETIVAAYDAHPPDLLILTLANVREGSFLLLDGNYAYGEKMLVWVKQHYEVVTIIPAPPSDPSAQWLLMRVKR
jgi:hypothetical protein